MGDWIVFLLLLSGVCAVLALAGWEPKSRPLPKDPTLPVSHVRPVGPRRRCAGCGLVKVTMDLADGWHGPALPYCAGCCKDTIGVEDAEGEVVA